jgi:hypothetical protein
MFIPVFIKINHLPVTHPAKSSPQISVLFLKNIFLYFPFIQSSVSSGLPFSGHSVEKIYIYIFLPYSMNDKFKSYCVICLLTFQIFGVDFIGVIVALSLDYRI